MPLVKRKTELPHVYQIDLYNDNLLQECAVLKEDRYGNTYFIKIADLDTVDKKRMGRILSHRYVNQLPLWDIMDQTTLKNGMNALEYFQQLVKAVNADGKPFTIRSGQTGYNVNQQMAINAENQKKRSDHEKTVLAEQELEAARAIVARNENNQ